MAKVWPLATDIEHGTDFGWVSCVIESNPEMERRTLYRLYRLLEEHRVDTQTVVHAVRAATDAAA